MDPKQQKHAKRATKQKKGAPPQAPMFRAMKIASPEPQLFVGEAPPRPKDPITTAVSNTKTPVQQATLPTRAGWDNPQLTPLGLYYPLGPCKVQLLRNELPQVLENLQRIFRTDSLYTQYSDSPISAICKSMDHVELEVVLFASRENPEEMILEISRRDGDACLFHFYAQHILSAVSGSSDSQPASSPSWNLEALGQADTLDAGESGESVSEALEITWDMVSTDRYDARRLGLESLVHMTDPNKSGWSTSKAVAEALMKPSGAIQERLSKSVLEYACRDVPVAGDSAHQSFGESSEADFAYLGLIIMSQTFQVAAGAQTLDVKSFLDVCPNDLVGSILQKVSDVQKNPHRAYYAIRCLASLCDCVPSTKSRISGVNVEEAQLVGESCHLALATATQKLLVSLQA